MYSLRRKGSKTTVHFLAMPRTGSRAIASWFRAHPSCVRDSDHHAVGSYYRRVRDGDPVLTTVRNHWDWYVSWYFHNEWAQDPVTGVSFEEFLLDNLHSPMTGKPWAIRPADKPGEARLFWRYVPLATHVMRYEKLQSDFEAILGHQVDLIQIARQQRNGAHYMDFYTKDLAEEVRKMFRREIEEYGYQFGD